MEIVAHEKPPQSSDRRSGRLTDVSKNPSPWHLFAEGKGEMILDLQLFEEHWIHLNDTRKSMTTNLSKNNLVQIGKLFNIALGKGFLGSSNDEGRCETR